MVVTWSLSHAVWLGLYFEVNYNVQILKIPVYVLCQLGQVVDFVRASLSPSNHTLIVRIE